MSAVALAPGSTFGSFGARHLPAHSTYQSDGAYYKAYTDSPGHLYLSQRSRRATTPGAMVMSDSTGRQLWRLVRPVVHSTTTASPSRIVPSLTIWALSPPLCTRPRSVSGNVVLAK